MRFAFVVNSPLYLLSRVLQSPFIQQLLLCVYGNNTVKHTLCIGPIATPHVHLRVFVRCCYSVRSAPVLASGHPVDTVPTIGLNVKVQLSWPFPSIVAISAIVLVGGQRIWWHGGSANGDVNLFGVQSCDAAQSRARKGASTRASCASGVNTRRVSSLPDLVVSPGCIPLLPMLFLVGRFSPTQPNVSPSSAPGVHVGASLTARQKGG